MSIFRLFWKQRDPPQLPVDLILYVGRFLPLRNYAKLGRLNKACLEVFKRTERGILARNIIARHYPSDEKLHYNLGRSYDWEYVQYHNRHQWGISNTQSYQFYRGAYASGYIRSYESFLVSTRENKFQHCFSDLTVDGSIYYLILIEFDHLEELLTLEWEALYSISNHYTTPELIGRHSSRHVFDYLMTSNPGAIIWDIMLTSAFMEHQEDFIDYLFENYPIQIRNILLTKEAVDPMKVRLREKHLLSLHKAHVDIEPLGHYVYHGEKELDLMIKLTDNPARMVSHLVVSYTVRNESSIPSVYRDEYSPEYLLEYIHTHLDPIFKAQINWVNLILSLDIKVCERRTNKNLEYLLLHDYLSERDIYCLFGYFTKGIYTFPMTEMDRRCYNIIQRHIGF